MHRLIILLVIITNFSLLYSQNNFSLKLNQEIKTESQKISLNMLSPYDEKSSTLAFFMSLIVPGAGEYYLDRFDLGKYFLMSEGALWLTVFGFNLYGSWQRDNYINYAKVNGGVTEKGKDESYWATIGNYLNIQDYNNEKLLNREFSKVLDVNTHYWFWRSNDERKKYRNIWLASESAFNNAQFPIALIVINHFASAINSAIIANRMKSKEEAKLHIYPKVRLDVHNNLELSFNLIKVF